MASLPYPRCPPNSFPRTHSKFVCASPPTEFTEFTEISGGGYSPTDFTDVHRFFFSDSRFCVFREFFQQNPFQVCLRKSSHGIHRIHRSFWRRIFSHRFHRIHRSFWRRRASHGFHRCTQIFLLRQSFLCVPRILWEDSFVAAWVWQGCHTHAALRILSTEPL